MLAAQVFVGSPAELEKDRAVVIREVSEVGETFVGRSVLLRGLDFRGVVGELGKPQDQIDRVLKASDLVVILLGANPAAGSIHEFTVASDACRRGKVQSLWLLLKQTGQGEARHPTVEAFVKEAGKGVLWAPYETGELAPVMRKRLTEWAAPLVDAARIAAMVGREISLVKTIAIPEPPSTDEIAILTRMKWGGRLRADAQSLLKQYREQGDRDDVQYSFHADPGKCWRVARLLYDLIAEGDPAPFETRAFNNPIHQFLSHFIRRGLSDETQPDPAPRIDKLRGWLVAGPKVRPIARHFAAFELGMCQAFEAADDLVERVAHEGEDREVRMYSAMALGMLRRRHTLGRLVQLFDHERDPAVRVALAHAVAAIAPPA